MMYEIETDSDLNSRFRGADWVLNYTAVTNQLTSASGSRPFHPVSWHFMFRIFVPVEPVSRNVAFY